MFIFSVTARSAVSLITIARCFFIVNKFFEIFLKIFKTCFRAVSSERRRRDLNPRAAINDLHPFQGCPFGQLGYFSILFLLSEKNIRFTSWILFIWLLLFCFSIFGQKNNGEGGIRTHVPLRTNGFQDRLVMTTSIPLRTLWSAGNSAQNWYYH